MSWLSPVIMLQKIPCPFGKLGWGISKTVLLEIPEEYPIAPGNTDAPLSPPPLALLSQSVYMNRLIKYLNFICFVLLMGELKKYSDKLEKVLLHKNEKLSMWWFCDIVPQLQSLGERSNCSHSNKRSLMKVF